MLSVEEAAGQVLDGIAAIPPQPIPLLDAVGLLLAEDVSAELDVPRVPNTSMDGYAVRAADTADASPHSPRTLRVIETLAAGYTPTRSVEPGTAIRIMTGAPIPDGADAVVEVELTRSRGDVVDVHAEVQPGRSLRPAGEDLKAGELALRAGTQLHAPEIAVLASVGRGSVLCVPRARVGILATGDELVEPGEPLPPGKVYDANAYALAAQVREAGGEPVMLGIARDTRDSLAEKLRQAQRAQVHLLLTSGGVSVGEFDLVKEMLAEYGKLEFWRVNMKPGKPLAFGHIDSLPMLGLPGNPVSTMVSFELFGRPAVQKLMGLPPAPRPQVTARLEQDYMKGDSRRHYVRVQLRTADGVHTASLSGGQGSAVLSSLSRAHGLAVIPEDWTAAVAGQEVQVMLLD